MNDDMTVLREGWPVQPPSPAAQNQARAALLARAAQTGVSPAPARSAPVRTRKPRWSGWAWRSGIATMAAAAVVGGLVLAGGLGNGTDGLSPTDALPVNPPANPQLIELAAAYAAAQPFTAPRPDQWTYVELKIANPGKIAETKGQQTDVTTKSWTRADGKQTADIFNGKLVTSDETADVSVFPPRDYPTLAGLPTDPQQLLSWMGERQNGLGKDTRDARTFSAITTILRENLLPPAVTASLLRALALIPGVVEASEPVEINGRPAIAVGIVQEGWLKSDILLDPETHEFLGSQDVAIADHSFTIQEGAVGGETKGDGPGAQPAGGQPDSASRGGEKVDIAKGEIQSMLVRSAILIVDAPGQTA